MAIKLRTIIKHPASVVGGTGIAVERENGTYTYSLDIDSLDTADTIPDDASAYLLVLTPGATSDDADLYEKITVETFLNETAAVNQDRQIISGAGLTGGGDLSADRTLAVGAGTGITVNADDVALNTSHVRNVDHSAVTITAGAGLTGGGTIESTRTLDVGAGTGIAVNANDVALAAQPAYTVMVNSTGSSAAPSGVKISALTDRAGFGPGDKVMIEESTGEMRKVDYNDFPGAGSIGGSTGATDNRVLRADGTGGATVQNSAVAIDDSGNITGAGTYNGGQVPFPATQSASADANTLDDYEEGTFTPGIAYGGASVGLTYTSQVGTYVKVGQLVHFTANVTINSQGSSTGAATLTGLPFTSANNSINTPVSTYMSGLTAGNVYLQSLVQPNATTILLRYMNSGAATDWNQTQIVSGSQVLVSGTYRAAA